MTLRIKPKDVADWDALALGEVMLRLDPGDSRIRAARSFTAWEGGGEYNVIRGLRKCFGLRTAVATALVDNEIGRLIEDFILQGGVGTDLLRWMAFDGIGRETRNGLNFVERGFGIRGPLGISDRGHSAASKLAAGDFDWKSIFADRGVRWFHSGGIFAALSETTAPLLIEAATAARSANTIVSFDFNYRASLWKILEARIDVQQTFEEIMEHTDVVFGGEADFSRIFKYSVPASATSAAQRFEAGASWLMKRFPGIKLVTTTIRTSLTDPQRQSLGAAALTSAGIEVCQPLENLEALDRVGSGDSFASGLIYGLISDRPLAESLRLGVAHAALALTTPGDNSMMSAREVEEVAQSGAIALTR